MMMIFLCVGCLSVRVHIIVYKLTGIECEHLAADLRYTKVVLNKIDGFSLSSLVLSYS